MVYGDSTRLREVLLNLLSNAGRITESRRCVGPSRRRRMAT